MPLEQKTKIGFDEYNFNRINNLQTELENILSDLIRLSDQSIGIDNCDDFKKLLESPSDYLVSTYAALWLKDKAPHLDRRMIFQDDTKISLIRLKVLAVEFWKAYNLMGNHIPTINAKGMISNVKKENFNIYLSKDKNKHYNALKSFLSSIESLKKHTQINGEMHIMRAISDLLIESGELKINIQNFKE
jgi:hypothetical protein